MNSYKKGRIYEDDLLVYGKRQPGSGCRWIAKEDILGTGQYSKFLIQGKNVAGQKSFSLSLKDLKNLRRNSCQVGRTGIFFINFGDSEEFVVFRRDDFDFYFTEDENLIGELNNQLLKKEEEIKLLKEKLNG